MRNSISHISVCAIFCACIAGVITGCEVDSQLAATPRQALVDGTPDVTWSQILATYDTSNLMGVVELKRDDQDVLYVNSIDQVVSYQKVNSNADASFWNGNGHATDVQDITVNDVPLHRAGTGSYYSRNSDEMVLNAGGGQNRFRVIGLTNSGLSSSLDSATFGAAPSILNLSRGDSVSRNAVMHLEWSGNASGFVNVSLMNWDLDSIHTVYPDSAGFTVSYLYHNTGAADIAIHPVQLHKGLATLDLTQYEPAFRTLSSGKRICYLLEATKEITVYIKD